MTRKSLIIILVVLMAVVLFSLLLVFSQAGLTGFVTKTNNAFKEISEEARASGAGVSEEFEEEGIVDSIVRRGSGGRSSSSGGGSSSGSNSGDETGGNGGGEEAEVFILPATSNYNKNEEFEINVKISTEKEIYAAEFVLTFNPSILQELEVVKGDFLSNGADTYPLILVNNTKGEINFASTRLGQVPGVSGTGNIAVIKFKAINAGASQLTLSNVQLADTTPEPGEIKVNIGNGGVNIA